jgi:hypothetical protein
MVATLYDLDSLYESKNPKSRIKDLDRCIEALRGVNGQVTRLRNLNTINEHHFYDYDEMRYDLVTKFLFSYCQEYYGTIDKRHITKLKDDMRQYISEGYNFFDIVRHLFDRMDKVK